MYNSILALTDGSEPSNHAIEHAAITAEKWGAKLKIMTVVSPPPKIYANIGGFSNDYNEDYEKAIMSYHLSVLEDAKNIIKEKCPDVKVTTQIKKGNTVQNILEACEAKDVDLVFIGSRGLNGLNGCFLGSVSNQIVNHCPKPIIVIK